MSVAANHVRCHGCNFEGVIQPRPITLRYHLPSGGTWQSGRAFGWCSACGGLRDIELTYNASEIRNRLNAKLAERRTGGGFLRGVIDRALGGGQDDVAAEREELVAQLGFAEIRISKPRCLTCGTTGASKVEFDNEGVSSGFRHSCGARLYVLPPNPDAPRFAYRPEAIDLDSEGNRLHRKVPEVAPIQASTTTPRSDAAQFNEYVDKWLTLDYGLPTEPRLEFFGLLEYQALVDQAWLEQTNDAEAALGIAAKCYAKLLASGEVVAARALAQRISAVGQEAFGEGLVSMNAVASALATVEWANAHRQT